MLFLSSQSTCPFGYMQCVVYTLMSIYKVDYLQCSLLSVPLVEGCLLWEKSVPGLLWEPLLRVARPDDAVPFQEAICCLSSVDTVTMHSLEGSEAAAAHELWMWELMPCRDFVADVWAVKWIVQENIHKRDTKIGHNDIKLALLTEFSVKDECCLINNI